MSMIQVRQSVLGTAGPRHRSRIGHASITLSLYGLRLSAMGGLLGQLWANLAGFSTLAGCPLHIPCTASHHITHRGLVRLVGY
jgi:hypothetical protein